MTAKESSSYDVDGRKLSDKEKIISVVNISILHEMEVFLAYDLLYPGRHAAAKDALLVALVHKFRQLFQTVLALTKTKNPHLENNRESYKTGCKLQWKQSVHINCCRSSTITKNIMSVSLTLEQKTQQQTQSYALL